MSDAENKAEDLKGRAKEAAGSLTGNDDLKSEGKTDQASSSVKGKIDDAAGKAKDVAESAKDKLTGN
ncbi:CsbD family protein [Aldersonia sp. NBC_00410]|uniref:CsbD family protein n=1 Tax=Aldersonia sp. NBC_00410 TaxID=2975954 RepID=UPI00225AE902|nr:CsbD family protein [Aldersonia sp. NBC_00410]MCX5043371.1 CsbD family protein [Aldersonia sp. NBC_00410]